MGLILRLNLPSQSHLRCIFFCQIKPSLATEINLFIASVFVCIALFDQVDREIPAELFRL